MLAVDSCQTGVEVCMQESGKKLFHVGLIPPLEGVVVQASSEEFAALTLRFFFVFFLQELDLFPGEKPDNTMKITGYSPVSKSTGYKQDLCKREWRKMGRLG